MKLELLYKREIMRSVDPVAKVDHRDADVIQQEIEEYFFTGALFENFHGFLSRFVGGTDETTGFWVNGFYGSGKSHFLKYLFYLLSDEHGDTAFKHLIDSLDKKAASLGDPMKVPDAQSYHKKLQQLDVAPVMFNISAFAKKGEDDETTVTETFFNRFNHYRGYHKSDLRIARFEKQLDRDGALDAFKAAFRDKTGESWEEEALMAVDFHLDEVLDAAATVSSLDEESTRKALLRDVEVSTDEFVDEIEAYLDEQPDTFRLVFLVDEVSQFMSGNENMLLDLQTIVEQIGTRCKDRVWVACTAQQELKELLDTTQVNSIRESFGKIIARFEQLPLEAQEADRIAKKRILEKSESDKDGEINAVRYLSNYFAENETALRNQFERGNDVYRGIQSEEEFVECYPFVPYQFTLITDVIQSFVQESFLVPGVSGTERSLIGITHETAKACKDEEVGYVVPFDAFFNKQIKDNLKNVARNVISRAMKLEKVQKKPFWQRVVRALFLLAYLSDTKSKNFPSTVENIAFVLMDEVDQGKTDLRHKTQTALDYLVENNVVSVDGSTYRFLMEEEIRVKNNIDEFNIKTGDRLEFLSRNIVGPLLDWSKSYSLDGTKINLKRKIDRKEIDPSGTIPVQILITQGGDPDQFALDRAKKDLVFCIHEAFETEQRAKLDEAVKVNAFKRANYDRAEGKRREAIQMFAEQAQDTVNELRSWFAEALKNGRYVSAQQVNDASDHAGGSARERYTSILDAHIRDVYNKRSMATDYASNRSKLEQIANNPQREFGASLQPAEQQVHNYLRNAPAPNATDAINQFAGIPYGWQDTEVIHILLNLERSNKWTFQYNSEDVPRGTFVEKAVNRSSRASITLRQQEEIDPTLLFQVTEAINQSMFTDTEVHQETDPKRLDAQITKVFEEKRKRYNDKARVESSMPYATHLEAARDAFADLLGFTKKPERFEAIIERAEEVGEQVDRAERTMEFVNTHGDDYRAMREFVSRRASDFDQLDPADREVAEKLKDYVRSEDEPYGHAFREMTTYYANVQDALNAKVEALRARVIEKYEDAFDDLEAYQEEMDVDGVLPPRSSKIDRVKRYSDPFQLEAEISKVNDFKKEYRVKIRNRYEEQKPPPEPDRGDDEDGGNSDKPGGGTPPLPPKPTKTSELFSVDTEMPAEDLETKEDVDAFVEFLRDRLYERIDDDKIIQVGL